MLLSGIKGIENISLLLWCSGGSLGINQHLAYDLIYMHIYDIYYILFSIHLLII